MENTTKMKAGEFKIRPRIEEPVWMDRKRITIFALPISFTKYEITPSRILVKSGILNTKEEEVALYRVRDISLSQTLIERMNGTGTLTIKSTDATTPVVMCKHVKNPRSVKELLGQLVDKNRNKNRVRTAEIMDGVDGDADGDGIPDSQESPNEGIFDA